MIKLKVYHSVSETDFGDYHSWSSDAYCGAHNDQATVMARTQECANKISAESGLVVEIEVIHYPKQAYPKYL